MKNKTNVISDRSIFKNIKLESSYDGRSIRQSINMYRYSISGIMKNFTISDGDKTIIQAPKPPKHKPTIMNVVLDGMKRYIFGSNGLFKIKRGDKKSSTKNLKTPNKKSVKIESIKPNSLFNKSRNKSHIDDLKQTNALFITDFKTDNNVQKSRNILPKLNLDSNFLTQTNTMFLNTFSSKKLGQQCSDIYKYNIELYNNFTQTSRPSKYIKSQKIRDYETDRIMFGDIERKYERHAVIRNNITKKNEFLDKRKVDLMRFGSNLEKIPDSNVLQYKKNIEQSYRSIAREADVDDICMRVKIKGDSRRLYRNNLQLKKLKKDIFIQREKYKQ
jgi:hypothetical protein